MADSDAVAGLTATLTVLNRVTLALADLLGSATLVAVTVTVCCVLMVAGAVYNPVLLIVPTFGLSVQVTNVFPDPPLTVAVNCWV